MSPDAWLHKGAGPAMTFEGDVASDFETEPLRLINDIETLRAISDPTRMRILETMVTRPDPAWSVKELAAALDVPQTRLYHHIELLAERDLVRATERRVVSGIIETRYRVTAMSFQLDRRLFAGDSEAGREILHETLAAVFDTARHEIEVAIRLGAIDKSGDSGPDHSRLLLTRGIARLTAARAEELRTRLIALEEEFDHDADGEVHGVVLAIYPMPPSEESHS